jgi:hypothetical protein
MQLSNRLLAICFLWIASLMGQTACGGGDGVGNQTGGPTGSAGSDGKPGDPTTASGATSDPNAADAMDEAGPCGGEREACCSDTTCTDPALTCADHFCLLCSVIPTLSTGCTNVALGIEPTALQTNPNNPLAYATDGSACTAWGSGDYVNVDDAGVAGTWWQLDLGATRAIDSMTLWMEQTPADAMVLMRIEWSTDGSTWTSFHDPADFTMLLRTNDPWLTPFLDNQNQPTSLRYLRITFLDSPSWISIRELALFQCSPGNAR